MGMLQLAGVVSGFGKGLQRGLENTQQYMTYSMLQQERDANERERLRLTFAHDEGLLAKRNELDMARDDRAHSRQLDLEDQRQDFQARQDRLNREATRQRDETAAQQQKDMEDIRRQNRISELVVEKGFSQQEAAQRVQAEEAAAKRKEQEQIAKEKRDEAATIRKEGRANKQQAAEFQQNTGHDIVLETLRGQRPSGSSAGSDKLDGTTNARLRILSDRIKDLNDELSNVMTTPERQQQIRREVASLQDQQNQLVGMQSSTPARPPIRFPQ